MGYVGTITWVYYKIVEKCNFRLKIKEPVSMLYLSESEAFTFASGTGVT